MSGPEILDESLFGDRPISAHPRACFGASRVLELCPERLNAEDEEGAWHRTRLEG